MIDRAALIEATDAFVDALNTDGTDSGLLPSVRVLAPLLAGLIADDVEETRRLTREILDAVFGREESR